LYIAERLNENDLRIIKKDFRNLTTLKLTSDDQYDMKNKRLCNVASPQNLKDAVNLICLRQNLSALRSEFIDLKTKNFEEDLDTLKGQIKEIKELVASCNSEIKNIRVSHSYFKDDIKQKFLENNLEY